MFNIPDPTNMPDVVLTATGMLSTTQLCTADNIAYVLTSLGVVPRLNMMTGEIVLTHADLDLKRPGKNMDLVLDMLTRMRIKSLDRAESIIREFAGDSPFHPMEDWLRELEWDGVDRLETLAKTIKTDNELWPVYLENWLVQVVEGVCGWRSPKPEHSLPYVLVLAGGQGIGKTHWLKSIGGAWLKSEAELHLSTSSGKDHQLEVLKYPMAELAELGSTFRKSDIDQLKAFISRGEDTIRAPYARRVDVRPRMCTLCASVNEPEFLNDPTGSRRFWSVWVEGITWGVKLDMSQLWAQAFAFWREDRGFQLSTKENAIRNRIARTTHTNISAEQEHCEAYIKAHLGVDSYPVKTMNKTDMCDMLFGRGKVTSPRARADIGRVLLDVLGPARTIGGKQRAWLVPYNDLAVDVDTWPNGFIKALSDIKGGT